MDCELALDPGKKYLSRKDYLAIALANFGISSLSGMIIGYLLIFYTSVLGISPAATAVMFLVCKLFDAFNDPIMGFIVDKTNSRFGKMRPYLIFCSLPFVIVAIIMFLPIVSWTNSAKIAFMYVTFFFYSITGTIVGVPIEGLATVITANIEERTKAIQLGRTIYTIGEQASLVIVALGFILTKNDMAMTYLFAAILLGVLAGFSLMYAGFTLRERVPSPAETPKLIDGFIYIYKNKQFLALFLSSLLNCYKWLFAGMVIYVVTYIYGDSSLQIFFSAPAGIGSMLMMIFVPALYRRFEAKTLFIFAIFWYSIGLLIVYLVGIREWWITAILLFFATGGSGIFNIMPTIMTADCIDYWEYKTGLRQEGLAFSLMSLKNKTGLGLKDFTIGFFLAYFMFNSPDNSILAHQPMQFAYTRKGMFAMFLAMPAGLSALAVIPLFFYKLNKAKMAEISAELEVMRAREQIVKARLEEQEKTNGKQARKKLNRTKAERARDAAKERATLRAIRSEVLHEESVEKRKKGKSADKQSAQDETDTADNPERAEQ
jgi:GPH family glycoside/pentoside/hexuronide:cation symporter